ncbi:carboxymuconolactone decarboxylase family protein [Nitratireductor sp. ZSWI3]|uniref:carboxymuconolactone decarboxylase family protein n=1 Tax=Nitratireductor sp. ZSWI3 TaxID=2966359 RepID=UPI00214F7C58|nr:carboxymuconolactone decarboxylase family protein [Nitratireductor sp. ZSWI3]MCR4265078.1 carboxymuconolactone decarboxylase family protein [Nitratireductor sp. ZSWI3]
MIAHHSDGVRVYAELRGEARADKMTSLAQKSGAEAAIADLSLEFVFGKVWARGGLDRKGRSLVTIGALIALRQTDELENHLRVALTNGLTKTEIEEAIVQTAPYAGFPAAWSAAKALSTLVDEPADDHP